MDWTILQNTNIKLIRQFNDLLKLELPFEYQNLP